MCDFEIVITCANRRHPLCHKQRYGTVVQSRQECMCSVASGDPVQGDKRTKEQQEIWLSTTATAGAVTAPGQPAAVPNLHVELCTERLPASITCIASQITASQPHTCCNDKVKAVTRRAGAKLPAAKPSALDRRGGQPGGPFL